VLNWTQIQPCRPRRLPRKHDSRHLCRPNHRNCELSNEHHWHRGAPLRQVVASKTRFSLTDAFCCAVGQPSFLEVQGIVASHVRGKVIVGHSLWKDFQVRISSLSFCHLISHSIHPQVLGLTHPTIDTRDIGLFMPFRQAVRMPNQVVGLPTLVWHLMRRQIQATVIDSVSHAYFLLLALKLNITTLDYLA
jgi:hypothetical protein